MFPSDKTNQLKTNLTSKNKFYIIFFSHGLLAYGRLYFSRHSNHILPQVSFQLFLTLFVHALWNIQINNLTYCLTLFLLTSDALSMLNIQIYIAHYISMTFRLLEVCFLFVFFLAGVFLFFVSFSASTSFDAGNYVSFCFFRLHFCFSVYALFVKIYRHVFLIILRIIIFLCGWRKNKYNLQSYHQSTTETL